MFGRKRFLQFDHNRFCHGRLLRELLGKRDNGFLQIIVRSAFRVIVEHLDLLLGKAGPLTEGFVVMDSVMTLVDQACLEVREFPQLGIQPALKACTERQGRIEDLGSVGHRAKDVRDHLQLCVEFLERRLRRTRGRVVAYGFKYRHVDFLSC